MNTRTLVRWLGAAFALWAFLVPGAGAIAAQTSTGTIRGTVRDSSGAALSEAEITVTNTELNVSRSYTTRADGAFYVAGLMPATYQVAVRHIGHGAQARQVRVLIGAISQADFLLSTHAIEVEEIVAEAARPVIETKTSEVATNVTQEQINNLPTSSRNFLDLAVLAPGTSLTNDRIDGTARAFSSGAQGPDQTNLFIDGVSYKNDLLHGGSVGQDRSRGNPFPRNTVQEYRILTQNYKAEYQKASSAIITAVTKSGGSTWQGDAFAAYQNRGLVALDTFQRADKKNNPAFREPDYKRWLVGLSAGGPIIRNRLHFFGAYEGNYQDRTNRVNIVPPAGFPALDTINFAKRNGFGESPFRSTLLFGKLSYAVNPNNSLEFSYNNRHENDVRDFGGNRPRESGVEFRNNTGSGLLKLNTWGGKWLNEAQVSYLRSRDNPSGLPGDEIVNRFYGGSFCCAQLGPDITIQDFMQQRIGLRNDLTFSGIDWNGQHVVKLGANLDFSYYRILKRNGAVPRFVYEQDPQGSATAPDSFRIPDRVEFRGGNPNFVADNQQIGAYLQDDWSPTSRLTLNLGLRWDYETRMMNYDYVTPQAIVDSLTKYSSSLFLPLDPNRYFTDGTQRGRFKGAFQPRLGFSYSVDQAGKTTVFGGWGLFYDRTLFDIAIEEKFAQQQPNYVIRFRDPGDTTSGRVDWDPSYLSGGRDALEALRRANPAAGLPEVKLLPNDLRPPKSQQFSLGVRQLVGSFALEAAYTGIRSKNVFTFYWANMNFTCPERSFGVPGCFVNNNIPGFATILFGTNAGKTWYDALQVKVDRPFRQGGRFPWGAGLAYTFAKRQTQGFNDDFSFPNPVDYPKQVRNDERHRLVMNGIVALPWLSGFEFGGLLTIGSGVKGDIGDRFNNPNDPNQRAFDPGGFDTPTYKNLDLRLRKPFPALGRAAAAVTVDLFNVFNTQNLGCYNHLNTPVGDPSFNNADCVISDPRRLQIGTEVSF